MAFKEKSTMFFATGGFIGKVSPIPGTLGSLWGIPICLLLSQMNMAIAGVLTLVLILFAIWSSGTAEKTLGQADPGCIVIDEIAGMVLTLFGLPLNLLTVIGGFVLFRILDILKPFPISFIERYFSGGAAIVFDDLAAGLASNVIIRVVLILLGLTV